MKGTNIKKYSLLRCECVAFLCIDSRFTDNIDPLRMSFASQTPIISSSSAPLQTIQHARVVYAALSCPARSGLINFAIFFFCLINFVTKEELNENKENIIFTALRPLSNNKKIISMSFWIERVREKIKNQQKMNTGAVRRIRFLAILVFSCSLSL